MKHFSLIFAFFIWSAQARIRTVETPAKMVKRVAILDLNTVSACMEKLEFSIAIVSDFYKTANKCVIKISEIPDSIFIQSRSLTHFTDSVKIDVKLTDTSLTLIIFSKKEKLTKEETLELLTDAFERADKKVEAIYIK